LFFVIVIALIAFSMRKWPTSASDRAVANATATAKARSLQSSPRAFDNFYSRLALQPEADRYRRLLGKRFLAPGREVAVMSGTITLGAERYTAHISRIQNDNGESLSIGLNDGPASLTWNAKDGAKAVGNKATGNQRALIERLALDSPDQFILAQTRGASYYTV